MSYTLDPVLEGSTIALIGDELVSRGAGIGGGSAGTQAGIAVVTTNLSSRLVLPDTVALMATTKWTATIVVYVTDPNVGVGVGGSMALANCTFSGPVTPGFAIRFRFNPPRPGILFRTQTTSRTLDAPAVAINKLCAMTVARVDTQMYFWVNGAFIGSVATGQANNPFTQNLCIGNSPSTDASDRQLRGGVQAVVFHDRVLATDEISTLHDALLGGEPIDDASFASFGYAPNEDPPPVPPSGGSMTVQPFPTITIPAQDTANDADSVSGIVTRAGHCVGVAACLNEDFDTTVPYAFSGGSTLADDHIFIVSNLENRGTLTTFANAINAGYVQTGTLGFDLTAPSGFDLRGIEIRQPDSLGRVVRGFGDGFHSSSEVLKDSDGAIVRVDTQMLTAKRFLTRNGVVLGELFADVPAGDIDTQDRYHNASPIIKITGGYVVFFSSHNEKLYFRAASTLAGLVTATSVQISPSTHNDTYADVTTDGETVWCQTRATIPSITENALALYEITDLLGTPSIDTIYLGRGRTTYRFYPRGLQYMGIRNGKKIVMGAVALRTIGATEVWSGGCGYVYNATDVTIFDAAKVDRTVGDGSAPTSGNTLASTEAFAGYSTGSIGRLDDFEMQDGTGLVLVPQLGWSPTGNRYLCDRVAFHLNESGGDWTRATFTFGYVDKAGTNPLEYANGTVRLACQQGATRTTSTSAAATGLQFGTFTEYSYRVPTIYLADGDDVIVYIVDQEEDGELSTSPAVFYYRGFGADGSLRKRRIAGVTGTAFASSAALVAAISTPSGWTDVDLPSRGINPKPIIGGTVDDVYLDIAFNSAISQTADQGALWSPTIDLGLQQASTGGHRSRARYDRAR
jgi:hypothetical protein